MVNQRPGDLLRDEWDDLTKPEIDRRGGQFAQVGLDNGKDNTGYRARFPTGGPEPAGANGDSDASPMLATRSVYILLHASDYALSWSIPKRHIAAAEWHARTVRTRAEEEATWIAVLLYNKPWRGYVVRADQFSTIGRARRLAVEIGRRDVESLEAFTTIEHCADIIEGVERPHASQPVEKTSQSLADVARRPMFCSAHHNLVRGILDGRWLCSSCLEQGTAGGSSE